VHKSSKLYAATRLCFAHHGPKCHCCGAMSASPHGSLNSHLSPACVADVSVGTDALEAAERDPSNVVHDVKRLIGRKFGEVSKLASMVPYHLVPGDDGEILLHLTSAERVTPQRVSNEILKVRINFTN
jgi:molecular chaperone DnaK (HSP70)